MADKSEQFVYLARLGFAARGVVYVLIGYIFLTGDRRPLGGSGPEGAFAWLQGAPGGTLALYLVALGLVGYGLFRGISALFNAEGLAADVEGIGNRLGHLASGLGHLFLAYTAFQFAVGSQASAATNGSQEAAGMLLATAVGPLALGLVGLGFLAAAAAQAKKAYTGHFMRRISAGAPRYVEPLGRAGYASRSVVFVMIGWSLVQAAWFGSSSEVMSFGEAMSALAETGAIATIVALGLIMFGVFSFALARYRILPDLDGKLSGRRFA